MTTEVPMTAPLSLEDTIATALDEAVKHRRARPWMHITPDGLPHFYVRTAPYDPEDMDLADALRAVSVVPAEPATHDTLRQAAQTAIDAYFGQPIDVVDEAMKALRVAVAAVDGEAPAT